MEFAPASRPHTPRESVVPMINVVFLLLIFFLMTAQITAPTPVEVTPPSVTLADWGATGRCDRTVARS